MPSTAIGESDIFDLFSKQWALVSAGRLDDFNACTVSWGSMGTLWRRPGTNGAVITIYLHPSRLTCEYMQKHQRFTVSFFPHAFRRSLQIMGSLSGRDANKTALAGLSPMTLDGSVGFEEATIEFTCRKLYQHQFSKADIAEDVQAYYENNPGAYPVDENGAWQPHWMFIGEVESVLRR